MNHNRFAFSFISLIALLVLVCLADAVHAQERTMFSKEEVDAARKGPATAAGNAVLGCNGPITQVIDLGFEGLKATSAIFGTNPGGGQGGQFDKTPILSTNVTLAKGACLDAHLSAIVGSRQTYGVSNLTLFQVTLTPASGAGGPQAIVGHFRTPYGVPSPAVGLEAERDVDMYASNFFQKAGKGAHELPPGTYKLDVWWAGAPAGSPGGAIGAGFVLKLYLR